MRFLNPEFLFLIPVFIFGFFWAKRRGRVAITFSSFKLLFRNKFYSSKIRLIIPEVFLFFVGIFLIIAIARPQGSFISQNQESYGIDIQIALDLSGSMIIEDFEGQNRLDVAKQTIKEFITKRNSDRIGLTVFSGEAITLMPNTLDHDMVLNQLQHVSLNTMKDGTAIGDAIGTAVARLRDLKSKSKSKIIILVTDGDNNSGVIEPLTAGDLAKGYGIRVYSIGIGKTGRVPFPQMTEDFFGRKQKVYQYVESTINPELLKQISAETDGKFFRAEDKETLQNVFEQIDKLEKNKIETKTKVKYTELFMYPLMLSTLLLMLYIFSKFTFARVLP